MMEEKIIEVKELRKKYKDFELRDISFSLDKGYIMGLIGRNGAGKTTLMNCILGKLSYENGSIKIDGKEEQLHRNMAKEDLGFIVEPGPFFQNDSLYRNGKLLGAFYENWDEEYFHRLLVEFELNSSKKYVDLSKGMKTKFQLAFALAHHPKLLILDEPTGGLDPVFRREFLFMIQGEVKESMMSVIISTHLTTDLDKVADYIMMLDNGRQLFYMDKEEMLDEYCLISGNIEMLETLDTEACGRIKTKGSSFTTILKRSAYLRKHKEINREIHVERATIEDIMYYLSERAL